MSAPELSPPELAERRAYLDLTEQDAAILRRQCKALNRLVAKIGEQFYAHLLAFPETARLLSTPGAIAHLRKTQHRY